MKILIENCGFIGFNLTEYLIKNGFNVVGIDNLNNYYNVNIKKKTRNFLKKIKNLSFLK